MPFANRMVILPCCDKKTYFCIRPVGGATLGTGIFAEIFNPGAFTYTNHTGTLVWAHLRFGRRIWPGKSCLWKPQLILEGWKYIWTMCGNGIGTVIAHRRNNEAARCPNAPVHSKTAHPSRAIPGHLTHVKLCTVGNLTQNEARPMGHLAFVSKRVFADGNERI